MASVSRYLRQNVLALVAIFLALNAGAYAVTADRNSVDSGAIQKGAVRGVDIHAGAVSAKKLKLKSVSQVLQSRVNGTCAAGQSIQAILADGSVACVDDKVGSATGAAGGDLTGTYPNPTLANGTVSAAKFAALPHGKVRQTGTCQSVPANGVFNPVRLDGLQFGSGVTFNDGADTLTVNTAGTYQVAANVNWVQDADGSRGLEVLTGADDEVAYDGREGSSAVNTGQSASGLVKLAAGTALKLTVGQNSGGALAFTDPFGDLGCANLSVQWVGP